MDSRPEIVVALVERDGLSGVLTGLHRGGYGHVTRVLDPERSDVAGQLRRAGSAVPVDLGAVSRRQVVVMVSAPARTGAAAELLRRLGANAVWETKRTGAASPFAFEPIPRRPRGRPAPVSEPVAD